MIYQFSYQYMRSTTPVSICKSFPQHLTFKANILQSLQSTMHTWHPTVLVLMSLLPHLMVLVVARSSRRLAKTLRFVLLLVVLLLDLLRLALPCQLRLLLSCLWVILTRVILFLRRFALVCGISKSLYLLELFALASSRFIFFDS
jgi:hypothetical protein